VDEGHRAEHRIAPVVRARPGTLGDVPRPLPEELRNHADLVAQLRERARRGPITLVYSAHDAEHNDAVVLRDIVLGRRR